MRNFFSLLLILLSINSFCQDLTPYQKHYYNIENLPFEKQIVIGDSLMSNAKNDHEFTYAYFYKAHTAMYDDDYNKSYAYLIKADSIVDKNNFKKEKITALNMLNGIYKNLKMYSNFYDNIQKINKIVEESPNNEYYTKVKGASYLSLANYYSFIDDNNNALKEYKRAIEFFENNKIYTIALIKAYNDLAMLYANMNQLDLSNETFNKMNAVNNKHVHSKHFMILYYLNIGVNYKIIKDYVKSKEYLEKGIELANKYNIESYKSPLNDQLAIIHEKLGNKPEADSLTALQFQKTKEVLNNKLEANNLVTKKINEESKEIIKQTNSSLNFVIIILIVVALVAIGIIFFQIKKRKEIKEKFEKIIQDYESKIDNTLTDVTILEQDNKLVNDLNMSKTKEKEIIEALQEFEKRQRYLDNDMSISNLATELNTNIKYVSYVIKKYRNSNYNNYINQLRVDYLVNLLIEDPKTRNYKLDHLANMVGFSTNSRLTNVFKQYKGISPSIFIKKLA